MGIVDVTMRVVGIGNTVHNGRSDDSGEQR